MVLTIFGSTVLAFILIGAASVWLHFRRHAWWRLLAPMQNEIDREPACYGLQVLVNPTLLGRCRIGFSGTVRSAEGVGAALAIVRRVIHKLGYRGYVIVRPESDDSGLWYRPGRSGGRLADTERTNSS